ncbi:MAG TPA: hypothetical protein VGK03_01200 [Geothrix sp.]|jgi:hypothetical protein
MKAPIFLPLVLLFGMACEPVTTFTRLNQTDYPSKPKDCDIKIFTQAPVDKKFEEIAILNTVTAEGNPAKGLNAMLPSIKATACGLGADAVLIKYVEPGDPSRQGSHGKTFAVAIKFLN